MKFHKKRSDRAYPFIPRLFATLLAGLLFVGLLPYLLFIIVPRLDTSLNLPLLAFGIPNYIIGGILIIVGLFFAFWSILDQLLHAGGTPLPIMATQSLLVSGPFKMCRNPMAFGTILAYTGIGILIRSLSSILVILLLSTLLLIYIKRAEEPELEASFGRAYLDYKKTTSFIIPRIFTIKR